MDVLEESRKSLPDERTLIDIRGHAYDLSRKAELLNEDAKNWGDVAIIRRTDEQSQYQRENSTITPLIKGRALEIIGPMLLAQHQLLHLRHQTQTPMAKRCWF
jgi:hypothetical protein